MTTLLARVEKLIVIALLDSTDVTDIVGDRIYTDTPDRPVEPHVRVNRIGGNPLPGAYWAEVALVQVDVFGGARATNWRVAETCRSVIAHLDGVYPDDRDRLSWHAVHPPTAGGLNETTGEDGKPHSRFDFTVLTHPDDAPPDDES